MKNTINVKLPNHACEIDQAFKPVLVCVNILTNLFDVSTEVKIGTFFCKNHKWSELIESIKMYIDDFLKKKKLCTK